jgi:hypothetical protein
MSMAGKTSGRGWGSPRVFYLNNVGDISLRLATISDNAAHRRHALGLSASWAWKIAGQRANVGDNGVFLSFFAGLFRLLPTLRQTLPAANCRSRLLLLFVIRFRPSKVSICSFSAKRT